MDSLYRTETHPACNPKAVVQGGRYRFTVLTSSLMRLEYSVDGNFEDRATQTVLNRNFPLHEYQVSVQNGLLTIRTDKLCLKYDTFQPFSANSLSIQLLGNLTNYFSLWRYGEEINDLGGTARTLDGADGEIPLEHGIVSRFGFSILDDSSSMVLDESGWVEARKGNNIDIYFFGYGHDYCQCLKDFYHLCGRASLLPRWALGNWWSRYHKYTEDEYKKLFLRFETEQVPFSVSVIDMDWHLVDIDPKYGSGWTGYTWNTELFPNPAEFLKWLHDHHLKVTLNVHPGDGVRAHEKAYPAIAEEMGVDVAAEEPVSFDASDSHFIESYFNLVHHPLEAEGVDFWWVDWQQGLVSRTPGLDPLWVLNHYHFLDSRRRGTRPITFSRYGGAGSHRYSIGFSGDSIVSWATLDFQPYFTANAGNIGYGWWSHDIGGHMNGIRDDELAARWVQFGVFSPIMRLHSSANPFNSKEPWRFHTIAQNTMKKYLRLRHRLIPYLYSMNRRASRDGLPLVLPMYYLDPECNEAYTVPNEYTFGTELIAAPITKPVDRRVMVAEARAWLPEGIWFDFFTGFAYDGGRTLSLWRPFEDMPVLAKAGAILPLNADEYASVDNPADLELYIFPGANGQFVLWEDSGDTSEDKDENWVSTLLALHWKDKQSFTIYPAEGNLSSIPEKRGYRLIFRCVEDTAVCVTANNTNMAVQRSYNAQTSTLTVELPEIPATCNIKVTFSQGLKIAENHITDASYSLLDRAQIEYNLKDRLQQLLAKMGPDALATVSSMGLEQPLFGALCEILLARKVFIKR